MYGICPIPLLAKISNKSCIGSPLFEIITTTIRPKLPIVAEAGLKILADIDYEEAQEQLSEFDVLLIPGQDGEEVAGGGVFPTNIIQGYVELQRQDPFRPRTLFSVCTGALWLARSGALQGVAATSHVDFIDHLRTAVNVASEEFGGPVTDVKVDKLVCNEPGAYLYTTAQELAPHHPHPSMRVITAGGVTYGINGALHLVHTLVSLEAAVAAARTIQYDWITHDGMLLKADMTPQPNLWG